jgi:hypothetical protein
MYHEENKFAKSVSSHFFAWPTHLHYCWFATFIVHNEGEKPENLWTPAFMIEKPFLGKKIISRRWVILIGLVRVGYDRSRKSRLAAMIATGSSRGVWQQRLDISFEYITVAPSDAISEVRPWQSRQAVMLFFHVITRRERFISNVHGSDRMISNVFDHDNRPYGDR